MLRSTMNTSTMVTPISATDNADNCGSALRFNKVEDLDRQGRQRRPNQNNEITT